MLNIPELSSYHFFAKAAYHSNSFPNVHKCLISLEFSSYSYIEESSFMRHGQLQSNRKAQLFFFKPFDYTGLDNYTFYYNS